MIEDRQRTVNEQLCAPEKPRKENRDWGDGSLSEVLSFPCESKNLGLAKYVLARARARACMRVCICACEPSACSFSLERQRVMGPGDTLV